MKSSNYFATLIIVCVAIACGSALDEATQTMPTKTTDTGINKLVVPEPVTAPPAGSSAALNPAHGQPGHRCDIQVGAPLNSAPASSNTGQTQTQPILMQPPAPSSSAPASAGTGAKNPAHGQPGHRCDIAVGAPLN